MTNEEKAKELGIKYQTPCHGIGDCEFEARQSALEMSEWKEQEMMELWNVARNVYEAWMGGTMDDVREWT